MEQPTQNHALLPCREYQLTSNHLHGEENCAECKAYNSKAKKPKKQLNLKADVYEKKAPTYKLNLNAASYKVEEKKNEQQEESKGEVPDYEEVFDYESDYDENNQNENEAGQNYHEVSQLLELGETHLALYEKYKDCECCHGMVFRCEGEVCKNLEACYCLMRDQAEDSLNK